MIGPILPVITYGCVLVFVSAVVVRAVRIARLPMHLRWELYPVAHEKGRARYGGSYLEELDWWTKPRASSVVGELKVMIPEIVLLAGVWEHNRKQWVRCWPFHFGLYLLALLVVLLAVGGAAGSFGMDVSADGGLWGKALFHGTYVVGYAGLGLGLIGALGLLARRVFDWDYRVYTKRADYFNLLFFVVTFAVALVAHIARDPEFIGLRGYVGRLLTLDFASTGAALPSPAVWFAAEVVLASLLLAYIPLTHMSHFFTKWFMYHDIRWSDEPNLGGGSIERQIRRAVQYPVSWSAPHIRGDGKKTWADVAASGAEEETNGE